MLTTLLGLQLGARESSIFLGHLMKVGPVAALLIAKIMAVLLVAAAMKYKRPRLVVFLNYWFTAVVTWNLGMILTARIPVDPPACPRLIPRSRPSSSRSASEPCPSDPPSTRIPAPGSRDIPPSPESPRCAANRPAELPPAVWTSLLKCTFVAYGAHHLDLRVRIVGKIAHVEIDPHPRRCRLLHDLHRGPGIGRDPAIVLHAERDALRRRLHGAALQRLHRHRDRLRFASRPWAPRRRRPACATRRASAPRPATCEPAPPPPPATPAWAAPCGRECRSCKSKRRSGKPAS